ncbi:MAG: hypothetical protein JW798_00360 [Prolixibacteraceae bacterium]|nr:hypothetical protein [Prolixibacteraceae bacterium]
MRYKENIFGLILFIAQHWTINGDSILNEKIGITTKQWMLLIILIKHFESEQPTISQAAKAFGSSRQNVKQVALSLQGKGFLNIQQDKKDSRIQRIVLTGRHKPYFEGLENEQWQQNFIDSLFEGFTDEELEKLNSLVEKLKKNISK